jgi:hypothetical protein
VETLGEEGKRTLTVQVDERLLALHRDMVGLARANRPTFIKNLAEIAVLSVNTRF